MKNVTIEACRPEGTGNYPIAKSAIDGAVGGLAIINLSFCIIAAVFK
jgi:hypothetical protein